MILFLDFDGVLHPDAVYRAAGRGIQLHAEGELMMHAPVLESILDGHDPHGEVRIILSTSWVRVLRFSRTLKYLPPGLRKHIRGATWHSGMCREDGIDPFDRLTRHEQIAQYVNRHAVRQWLAIDDLHSGHEHWPQDMRHRLVLTDGGMGLGCPHAQKDLRAKLKLLSKPGDCNERSCPADQ